MSEKKKKTNPVWAIFWLLVAVLLVIPFMLGMCSAVAQEIPDIKDQSGVRSAQEVRQAAD